MSSPDFDALRARKPNLAAAFEAVRDFLASGANRRVTASYMAARIGREGRETASAADALADEGLVQRVFVVHCEGKRIRSYLAAEEIPDPVYCDLHDERHTLADVEVWKVYSPVPCEPGASGGCDPPPLDRGLPVDMTYDADVDGWQPQSPCEESAERARGLAGAATIGILTALPKECAAVRRALTGEVRWHAEGEGGGRGYYLGEIASSQGGAHVVALALLPDMGNNSAALRAQALLHHFPSVKRIIMCGIAGGIPRPGDVEHDVRLGDIVVSNRNGVVQYDLVKELPDGTKEHRHPPRPPAAELLDAVRHLQTEDEMGRRPWEAFIPECAQIKGGSRPADDVDARGNRVAYPPDTERSAGRPRVFHSPIAAANTLLKNSAHRDYLGITFGVKAVEMEGAGVADASWLDGAGYLVVRGICDYCDEHKGDVWHGPAAAAAAAYTRALIEAM